MENLYKETAKKEQIAKLSTTPMICIIKAPITEESFKLVIGLRNVDVDKIEEVGFFFSKDINSKEKTKVIVPSGGIKWNPLFDDMILLPYVKVKKEPGIFGQSYCGCNITKVAKPKETKICGKVEAKKIC